MLSKVPIKGIGYPTENAIPYGKIVLRKKFIVKIGGIINLLFSLYNIVNKN